MLIIINIFLLKDKCENDRSLFKIFRSLEGVILMTDDADVYYKVLYKFPVTYF